MVVASKIEKILGKSGTLRIHQKLAANLKKGTIIDIETTGLEPESDDIIILGWIQKDELFVVQRAEPIPKSLFGFRASAEKDKFHTALKKIIKDFLIKPIYAFNAEFEKDFIKSKLGIDLNIIDVAKPWFEKAEKKGLPRPKLDSLVTIPKEYYHKTLSSKQIPLVWAEFEKGNKRRLWQIWEHNKDDLLQTLFLILHTSEEKLK